ncbi:hypothetical protein Pcinc_038889 [Petrolisthes cinctipes]|uniref:Uncharacterized protein n=1 Tax=Petrolisthes cinctipes TaxID=88211 RepID=A0AAE1BQI1_PETCI|nr:hypothetical protein Pcinc_038889 [Petrolisthes cinctipes]
MGKKVFVRKPRGLGHNTGTYGHIPRAELRLDEMAHLDGSSLFEDKHDLGRGKRAVRTVALTIVHYSPSLFPF